MVICCFSPANVSNSVLNVEYKIPVNCDDCKKTMTDTIPKFKGVTSCVADTKNHKFVVSGSFNREKLLKKLMRGTCNAVEMVVISEKKDDDESEIVIQKKSDDIILEKIEESEIVTEEVVEAEKIIEPKSDDIIPEKIEESEIVPLIVPEEVAKAEKIFEERKEMEKFLMFSDENPNTKCTIS